MSLTPQGLKTEIIIAHENCTVQQSNLEWSGSGVLLIGCVQNHPLEPA